MNNSWVDYQIKGFYYKINGYTFRKYLNIIHKIDAPNQPDLMVVMMNPGSSSPEGGFTENIFLKEVITNPDPTQRHIASFMEKREYKYARIINLSDYSNPESNDFYKELTVLKNQNPSHSIFHESRQSDFNELFIKGVPVIAAWGVSYKLNALIKLAVQKFKELDVTPIGLLKTGTNYKYYHPQRRIDKTHHFKSWKEEMLEAY